MLRITVTISPTLYAELVNQNALQALEDAWIWIVANHFGGKLGEVPVIWDTPLRMRNTQPLCLDVYFPARYAATENNRNMLKGALVGSMRASKYLRRVNVTVGIIPIEDWLQEEVKRSVVELSRHNVYILDPNSAFDEEGTPCWEFVIRRESEINPSEREIQFEKGASVAHMMRGLTALLKEIAHPDDFINGNIAWIQRQLTVDYYAYHESRSATQTDQIHLRR